MKTKFSDKQLALFAIIGAIIIGGGLAPSTKIALQSMPVFTYNFIRFAAATLTLFPFFLKNAPKTSKHFYKVLAFSLFLTANVMLAPFGLALTTAIIAQTIYILVPIIVAIISYFLAVEVFTMRKISGLIIGFLGAVIIIILPEIERFSPFSGNIYGNLIILTAAITMALYTVFAKQFHKIYTPLQLTCFFVFMTFALTIPFAVSDIVYHPHWWLHVTTIGIIAALYNGILGTTGYYVLYQYAIKHGSPTIASMLLYLQPAATFVWANLLLGEQLTTGFLIGTALAFTGVYLTMQYKNKERHETFGE
jgi:drug/metabolite transporter (DMT)-like permease